MPQVASVRSSSVTASTRSSGPTLSTCVACGTIAARSAPRIALDTSPRTSRSAKARSARIAALLRNTAQRGAVLCIDLIELRRECRERGVAELRDEVAREIAGQARAVLRATERRPVEIVLRGALALQEALRVQA